MGPGERFAVWLQGCCFSCPGCVAPGFIPQIGGELVDIQFLVDAVLSETGSTGITISGGEPLLQAEALTHLLSGIRAARDHSVILYTGFTFAELMQLQIKDAWVKRVLALVDVLIEGRYDHALNDSKGLRGSSNQVVRMLTDRHADDRKLFEETERRLEHHAYGTDIMIVGLPDLKSWRRAALDPTGRIVLGRQS